MLPTVMLPASGCCTGLMWVAAPSLWPERLIGARVDAEGALEVGVEMSDGRRLVYRLPSTASGHLEMEPEPATDAANLEWTCKPDASGRIVGLF